MVRGLGLRHGSGADVIADNLPCSGSATQATACAAGRPRPAGRPSIVTCSRSSLTTVAVERLRPSLSALRNAEERLAAVIRRRAGQPRQPKQTRHAVLDTLGVLVPRAPEAPPPPASLVAIPGSDSLVAVHGPYGEPPRPGPPGVAAIRHSRPSRPNSSTPSRRGRRRTPAAHRRRCASAPLTWRASSSAGYKAGHKKTRMA